MQSSELTIGGLIEGRCTKCRKNTEHSILTLKEDAPLKVECSVCNRQHKYRPPTAVKKPALSPQEVLKAAARKEWALLRPEMNTAKSTDYSMTATYKAKALINHPVFGLGLVERVAGSQKIEVLFEDGRKVMRCK